jgi:hypothetical protein
MATAGPAAGRRRVTTRRARCRRRFAELTPNNNSVPHTGHFSNFRTFGPISSDMSSESLTDERESVSAQQQPILVPPAFRSGQLDPQLVRKSKDKGRLSSWCSYLTAGATNHAVCMEDLHFSPSLDNPTRVYVCFRSTKTRPRAANTPFWQALDAQPQLRWCPVALLRMHFMRAYRGQPSAPLFCAARDPRTPWPRSTFTGSLRRRLERASRHLDIPVDLRLFSGISFRKGSLSTLGAAGVPSHRLADHGDHASVQSSRRYTLDSLSQRAANSGIIAAAFRL